MKNNPFYLSLVSGLIGVTIGASSMYVVQASIIKRGITTHSAATEQTRAASTREIKQQGLQNQADRGESNPEAKRVIKAMQ